MGGTCASIGAPSKVTRSSSKSQWKMKKQTNPYCYKSEWLMSL